MREIKFRAWNEISSRMDNWCDLVDKNLRNIFIMKNHNGYELMQYTGLHDKNGKEIYEGDILKFKMYDGQYENYQIIFRDAAFEAINNDDSNFISSDIWNIYGEVIGNIYDNPELLKEE